MMSKSSKRRADTELNRDNWDVEDEPEEVGCFQKASEDILKSRVIKTAKRRSAGIDSEQKSIFSGFGGFSSNSESKKPSFSFLSNLTNNNNIISNDKTTSTFACLPNMPNEVKCDETSSESNKVKLTELSQQLKKTSDEKESENSSNSKEDTIDEKSPDGVFLQKLKSLNLLCAEWIIKHLNENLTYILTPGFDDYKTFLNQLKEERQKANSVLSSNKKCKIDEKPPANQLTSEPNKLENSSSTSSTVLGIPNFKDSVSQLNFSNKFFFKQSVDTSNNETCNLQFNSPSDKKYDGNLFKFGADANKSSPLENKNVTDLKPEKSSFFSFKPDINFGDQFKKPFPIDNDSSTIELTTDNGADNAKEDANIVEEGSVYDKKCKVYIKKDSFVDHGVGILFLKLIGEDKKKCQLIVRANNKLANIIINVIINSNVPIQRKDKNYVMIVCCPTPNSNSTSVLLKVKTNEDADELFETLNKYKQ